MAKKQRTRRPAGTRSAHQTPATPASPAAPAVAAAVATAPPARPEPVSPVSASSEPSPPPALGWARPDWLIVAGAIVLALVLYCWRLNVPKGLVFDEVYHGFTAAQIVKGNADAWVWNTQLPPDAPQGVAYEWTHPAFSKLLIGLGIRIV